MLKNSDLQAAVKVIEESQAFTDEEKARVIQSVRKVDKELEIVNFKLDRTEKVKRTTAILLEETIEELEQKRKAVEETNDALNKSMEELKATQKQLIHAEKMASLGELTAGIAHEIQNPLNFVNNFSDVSFEMIDEMWEEIENGDLDEAKALANEIKSNLEKITHHGKRADGIVKGMLQHSRTDSGQKIPTDLNALVDEYLRLAYHGFRAKDKNFNAYYKTVFDPDLPKIEVMPQDIGRVLLNLINNAFHAVSSKALVKEGGSSRPLASDETSYKPTVTVATKSLGDNIEISVKDNGPGIPDEIKDKIFQPFFTTKPTGEGTGLGLSLSYDIVKAHGGELSLENSTDESVADNITGTVFLIRLPVNKRNTL